MSLTSTTTRAQYTANGTTTAFATGFYFLENSDVSIQQTIGSVTTVLNQGSDYTVSGALNPSGGTATFAIAPVSGAILTVIRTTPNTQEITFVDNDALPAASLEEGLDKLTMEVQELRTGGAPLTRAVQFPITEPATTNTILPNQAGRIGKIFGFDNNGNILLFTDIGQWRGEWETATAYNFRDFFQDSITQNLYVVTASYTSGASVAADVASGNAVLVLNVETLVSGSLPFDQNQYAVASGTNTITATVSPVPVSYSTGMEVALKIANTNTGAATLNLNGVGAIAIQRNGSALSGGEMVAGQVAMFRYDGTYFSLGNPTGSGTPTGAAGGDLSGTFPNPVVASLLSGVVTLPSYNGAVSSHIYFGFRITGGPSFLVTGLPPSNGDTSPTTVASVLDTSTGLVHVTTNGGATWLAPGGGDLSTSTALPTVLSALNGGVIFNNFRGAVSGHIYCGLSASGGGNFYIGAAAPSNGDTSPAANAMILNTNGASGSLIYKTSNSGTTWTVVI